MTNIQFIPSAIDAGGCISNAWELVKRNYGLYLGMAIIAVILAGCIPCVSLFLLGPVMGGVFYVVLRDMRGEPVEFGMMFKGFEKFVPLIVVGLLQAIPGIIAQVLRFTVNLGQLGLEGGRRNGSFQFLQSSGPDFAVAGGVLVIAAIVGVVFMIFSVAWAVAFFFAIPLALEHDIGPIDAIKLSAQAALSNVGGLILLIILEGLVVLLGLVMICLGVFFISLPIVYAANALAYRQVFPWIEQNFNMAPPPPNVYGGGYGQGQYS